MKLKDLIQKFTWEQIKEHYFEIFPNYLKEDIPSFDLFWKELERLLPLSKDSNMTIFVKKLEQGYDVYGENGTLNEHTGKPETYAMEFTAWEEWFGMKVSEETLATLPELDIACHCIYEMTFFGHDQESVKAESDELKRRWEEVESGKAKLIPWEEVKERLGEMLKEVPEDKESELLDWEKDSYTNDPFFGSGPA